MITRSEWGARTPKHITPAGDKTGGIIVHWTGTTSAVKSHWPGCWERWRQHQNYHMDRKGWSDIAYNQLVCPHGFWFEGRGWDSENGANLPENSRTLSVCLEAGPGYTTLEPAAVETINRLIDEAVSRGWAPTVRGHQQVSTTGTQCPGNLQPLIRSGTIRVIAAPPPEGTPVMGTAQVSVGQAVEFVTQRAVNADYPTDTVAEIVKIAYRIADTEGVRPDLAVALMCKETGFFSYGEDVQPDQWNFGGIGATGGVPGLSFPTLQAGVHAVIRRMRMYAVNDPSAYDPAVLGRALPSSHWGKYPHIEDFNGVWAVPGTNYGQSIVAMVELMKQTPVPVTPSAPFADFEIEWMDARYQRRAL